MLDKTNAENEDLGKENTMEKYFDPVCELSVTLSQVNHINWLMKKDDPVDLIPVETTAGEYSKCPVCGKWFGKGGVTNFCPDCGQRLTGSASNNKPFEEAEV